MGHLRVAEHGPGEVVAIAVVAVGPTRHVDLVRMTCDAEK